MTAAADPTLGVSAYLKAQEPVNVASEGRVLRPELLRAEDKFMPRVCIVVRPAGGGQLFGRGYLPVKDSRLDIVCYGGTRLEAENCAREVAAALQELKRSTWEKVILFWARLSAEPSAAAENEVDWPFSLVSAQVMHATRTLP